MLIFLQHNLVFLAVPKAGSTACEAALRPFASIAVKRPPQARHMNARRYAKTWAPFLRRVWHVTPETMAVLRDPRERLESWYKYRHAGDRQKSTAEMTFDAFVQAVLSDDPPEMARIGAQDHFAMAENERILIDHLFTLDQPEPLHAFLAGRFGGDIVIGPRNVSPDADVTLSAETEGRLYEMRAREFALYERVAETGHLHTPQARK